MTLCVGEEHLCHASWCLHLHVVVSRTENPTASFHPNIPHRPQQPPSMNSTQRRAPPLFSFLKHRNNVRQPQTKQKKSVSLFRNQEWNIPTTWFPTTQPQKKHATNKEKKQQEIQHVPVSTAKEKGVPHQDNKRHKRKHSSY